MLPEVPGELFDVADARIADLAAGNLFERPLGDARPLGNGRPTSLASLKATQDVLMKGLVHGLKV